MADKDQAEESEKMETAEPEGQQAEDDAKAGKAADGKAADGKAAKADKKASKADAKKEPRKAAKKDAGSKRPRAKKAKGAGLPTAAWVVIVVVALVCGGLIGRFVLGGLGRGGVSGKTTVSEDELDTTMGTYTYDGQTYNVSVRDVIKQSSSLDAAKKDDGTYEIPSADGVLSVARTQILMKEADKQGISVSDDDISDYAQQTLGTSDIDSIATSYSMDSDDAKELIRESAVMKKLQDQVVGEDDSTAPTAPTAPASGQEETPTADYAQYIINLAGDEWDSDNQTWKDSSSDYATALADYTITNDSATYEAAQAAYYVAYQKYSQEQSDRTSKWTDYVNGLLQNAQCTVSSLVA